MGIKNKNENKRKNNILKRKEHLKERKLILKELFKSENLKRQNQIF